MTTPKSISGRHNLDPVTPLQTISFSNRESSPRAASLARLAQSPILLTPRQRSGTATPITQPLATPLLSPDFRKIDPAGGAYGSVGSRTAAPSGLSRQEWTREDEDPEIIRKHLVSGLEWSSRANTPPILSNRDAEMSKSVGGEDDVPFDESFNSLQLQGGDVTRQVYRYAEQSLPRRTTPQRSHSFSHPARPEREETVQGIMVPGGFRRNFIQRSYTQPGAGQDELRPTFLTRNFLHFLTLYGHFAGEDLEEWDEAVTSGMSTHGEG